jgi:ATP-binding cassette subfamily C protein
MAAVPGVRRSELGDALRACRSAFLGVGAMSCMINLLYLTGSVFMLEIYDRVLPSRSVPTLVGLVILAGGLYIAQGVLDLIRGRILIRIGTSLDEALNARVFETVVRLPLMVGGRNEGLQPLRDLDNVRSFLSGMGPGAFFDLPWLPFYLAICFAFHVLIGLTALVGAIILITLTIVTEFMSRAPAREAMGLAARRNDLAATSRRNAEVLVAMGMAGRLTKRWSEANQNYLTGNQRASDVSGGLGAIAKVMRMTLQSAVLGVGAYLVIHQEATAGIIIARTGSADVTSKPIEPAVGRGCQHCAAGRSENYRPGRDLRPSGRKRAGRDRAERIGQVFAGARAGRRMATVSRQGAARWRSTRSVVVRCARPSRRLPAAGRRTVRRDGRPEYLPLRSGRRC